MTRAPQRPRPLLVEPPQGPAIHARPIRPPSGRSPDWYWRATCYEGGAERTVWTGRAPREDVRAQLWQLIGAGGHLSRPETPDGAVVEVVTVADLLAHWRGHIVHGRADLAPATVATYQGHSRVVEEILGPMLIEQLSRADLDRYRAIASRPPPPGSRRRTARSAGSLSLDLTVLEMAWTWGRSVGACPPRDLDLPHIAPKPVRERYTPTAGEVAEVVRHLDGWRRDVVALQWATGCRVGELAALLVGDVDLDRAELLVGRHVGARKTGARRVPVHPDTVPMLRRLVGDRAHTCGLWPVSFQVVRHAINPSLAEACAAARVPVWTTHALRRAYIIRAVRAGIDVATVATITGHSVEELLATYRQVQDEDRRAAVARLPGALPRGEVVSLVAVGDPHTRPAQGEET